MLPTPLSRRLDVVVPPLLVAAANPVPIWMCLGILDVGDGRMREEEVLKAEGSNIWMGERELSKNLIPEVSKLYANDGSMLHLRVKITSYLYSNS